MMFLETVVRNLDLADVLGGRSMTAIEAYIMTGTELLLAQVETGQWLIFSAWKEVADNLYTLLPSDYVGHYLGERDGARRWAEMNTPMIMIGLSRGPNKTSEGRRSTTRA